MAVACLPLLVYVLTNSLIVALVVAAGLGGATFILRRKLFFGGMMGILKELKQLGSENLIFASFSSEGLDDLWLELAKELDALFKNIRIMIRELQMTSEQTSTSAESLAANMQHVEAAAQTMAGNLERVFAGLSGQTESVRSVVSVAQQNVAANEKELQKRIAGVQQLASFATGLGSLFSHLTEQTRKVDRITKTIDEIADQISILSINASIEAALAGEKGKGFAVLAGEVRELAERATEATEDTRKIIEAIKQDIATVGSQIEENQRIAEHELTSIEAARTGLNAMSQSIAQVATSVGQFVDEAGEDLATANSVIHDQGRAIATVSDTAEQVSNQVDQVYKALANFGGLQTGAQAMHQQINEARTALEQLAQSEDIRSMEQSKHRAALATLPAQIALGFSADTKGDLVAATQEVNLKNVAFRTYCRVALSGRNYVSDAYISSTNNMPCVTISMPIKRGGEVVGMIAADVTLEVGITL